jgi:hypothetical protein
MLGDPDPAQGQGNIRLGPLRIFPYLEQSFEYNDNILLAPRDARTDFIFTTSPGFSIELPARPYAFRLGYRADILRYLDNTDLDDVFHTVQGDARANFAGGLNLYLSEEFKHTSDFAGFPVPELLTRIPRNENRLKAGAEYGLRRITLAFDYRFFLVDYRSDPIFDELDYKEHTWGLTGSYQVLPKTSVLLEYNYQIVRYELDSVADDRDSQSHKVKVGVKGDLTAKITALVKVGYEWKDFDNPGQRDFNSVIAEADVTYKYREPSQLRLFFVRAPIESTFTGANFYVSTYGGAELRHHFTPKLRAQVVGLVGVNDYPEPVTLDGEPKARLDRFFEVGAGIRYQIQRWLAADLGYSYLSRGSNFSDFDYRNHRVKATIILTF